MPNQPPANIVPTPPDANMGSEFRINTVTADWQTAPEVKKLADGGYVAVWQSLGQDGSFAGIYSQRYDASGGPAGPEVRVNSTVDDTQFDPAVGALDGGGYIVAWSSASQQGGGPGTYIQRYDSAGNPVGSETLVLAEMGAEVAGLADGGYVLAWIGDASDGVRPSAVYARRYDASGTAVGSATEVSAVNDVRHVSVIGLAEGGFALAWTSVVGPDQTDVHARQYDSSGQALGAEIEVNTTAGGNHIFPDIAALAGGGHVIIWRYDDFDLGSAVYAQRYDENGAAVGGEMLLSSSSEVNHYGLPVAAGLTEGGFVITWPAQTPANNFDVFARRFHDSGAPVGAVTRINTITGGPQAAAAIAALDGDTYVVLWASFIGNQFDVQAQLRGPALFGNEDANFVFSSALGNAIAVSDADAATLIVSLTAVGRLTLSSTAGLSFSAGDGTSDSAMTFSGTPAAINAALEGLTYRGQLNQQGADIITITTSDDGNGDPAQVLTDVDAIVAYLADDGIIHGDGGANSVNGTGSADFFRLDQGGDDSALGGGGNDVMLFGSTLTSADSVDGGAGLDQIAIQGDYWGAKAVTLGAGVVSVESIAILPGNDLRFGDPGTNLYSYDLTTVDANVAANVQLGIDANRLRAGEDFTFDGSAETDGSFFIYGGGGTDRLTGGANNDVFLFGANGQWDPGDRIDGGSGGIDQLGLRGNYTVAFGADQLVGIENFGLVSAQDTRFGPLGAVYSYDLTMHDDNVATGGQLTVDSAALRAGETLTFNGAAETDGTFRIFGGRNNDIITGGQGADVLLGGLGSDLLRGEGGADLFGYRSAAESSGITFDRLDGFDWREDRIDLATPVSGWTGNIAGGSLSSASFDADLAAAVDAGLQANSAVLFRPDSGDFAGRVFAVVDGNGDGAYQTGQDYVFELVAPAIAFPPIDPIFV